MPKINKYIEIVCSTETKLSSMSQSSRNAILAVLSKHYREVHITIVNNLSDLNALIAKKPDLVFLGMKFIPVNPSPETGDADKIWVADYLDRHEITYTGSNHEAHELELNKHLAKQRALDSGIDTSPFYVALKNERQTKESMILNFPLFIKPTNRGGGLGVDSQSVAENFDQLVSKIFSIEANHQSDSLVEEYLPGREFSVAILKDSSDILEFSVMPLELIAPADEYGVRILSGEIKEADLEQFAEVTDPKIKAKLTKMALSVFKALGARDYGRIDIRMDQFGTPKFLEANLLPSLLRNYGNFPKACKINIGLDWESVILNIADLGFLRATNSKELLTV